MKKPPLNLPWHVEDHGNDAYIVDCNGFGVVTRSECSDTEEDHERLMHHICECVNKTEALALLSPTGE